MGVNTSLTLFLGSPGGRWFSLTAVPVFLVLRTPLSRTSEHEEFPEDRFNDHLFQGSFISGNGY